MRLLRRHLAVPKLVGFSQDRDLEHEVRLFSPVRMLYVLGLGELSTHKSGTRMAPVSRFETESIPGIC